MDFAEARVHQNLLVDNEFPSKLTVLLGIPPFWSNPYVPLEWMMSYLCDILVKCHTYFFYRIAGFVASRAPRNLPSGNLT